MPPIYKVHPGIGIARLGNSPDKFCISPEKPADLPIACDAHGNPLLSPDGQSALHIDNFKDAEGRIKRQAARFQVYVYDDASPDGRPLELGDPVEGGGNQGVLVDIQWRGYVANKKAVWYEFHQLQGEHGYAADAPRRNADIVDAEARQRLIIDPGPQIVNCKDRRRAAFNRENKNYAPTFPPALKPHSIDTLGELMTDDIGRLLVLGGHGHSGSYKYDDFGQPRIESYANNDGWFDDISDGPIMARLTMYSPIVDRLRFIDVEYPAWVLVGYPAYVPQILDMITLDDVVTNLAIQQFADRPDLFGPLGTYDDPGRIDPTDTGALVHWRAGPLEWNPRHKPWFYRDIWPILFRPDEFTYLTNVLAQSNFPHNQSARGKFDPYKLGLPPIVNQRALQECEQACMDKNQSGELFLEALEEILTTINAQANSTVRQALSSFDDTVTNLVTGYESQGREFPHQDRYRAWLNRVGQGFPMFLGDQLFDDFKAAVKKVVGQFAQAIHDKKVAVLASYARSWQHVYGEPSSDYEQEKDKLESAVDKIIAKLVKASLKRWQADIDGITKLFQQWGEPFKQQQTDLETEIGEYVREFVFQRLGNYTQQKLREYRAGTILESCKQKCIEESTYDPYRENRKYLFKLLRQPGEENEFRLTGKPNNRLYNLPLMPLLCGDNPISNTLSSKFLRLTDYQLFILRQWARGQFYNEEMEGWTKAKPDPFNPYAGWVNRTGRDLDRGVLTNLLGGAFCPGGEVNWIIRNTAIYHAPWRIKADPDFYNFQQTPAQANQQSGGVPSQDYSGYADTELSQDSNFDRGLQPGDLTKYMALPWQADFNECSTQNIDVTFELFNELDPTSEGDGLLAREAAVWNTLWWPAHRPLQTFEVTGFSPGGGPTYQMLDWSRGIPATSAGDLKMTTAWSELGFVVRNPFVPAAALDQPSPIDQNIDKYISVERNQSEANE